MTSLDNACVGTSVGPYRVCLELGSGGMATVYLARTRSGVGRNRFVALKVIHPHLARDRGFVEMFMDEAEIASRIRHPNVCGVVDFDFRDGNHYIAMEYLVGESMASIWRKVARQPEDAGDLHARRIARALADACEGLHAAHDLVTSDGDRLEVVHRDVSPENVFLTYDGVTKIVDFGVAAADGKRHRTRTGIVKGKFAYVAPELLAGKKKIDRRVDVWGIGVIAWELLTGQRLFRRETDLETLRAVQRGKIKPPSEIRPGVPRELDEIVMKALSRDPSGRHATARELGRAFARFADRDGQIVTASDLAEWLEELFPGGRARNHQVLDLSDQMVPSDGAQTVVETSLPLLGTAELRAMLTEAGQGDPRERPSRPSRRSLLPSLESIPKLHLERLRDRRALWLAVALAAGAIFGSLTDDVFARAETTAAAAPEIAEESPPILPAAAPVQAIVPFEGSAYGIEVVGATPDGVLLHVRLPEREIAPPSP